MCGTDLHAHHGIFPLKPPIVAGHEPTGDIVELGPRVVDLKVGDRVGVFWHQKGCGRCAACHSQDYIPMNSPFLDRKGWEAEVNKMVKAYGAPMEPGEAEKIIDYLATNYGKK